MTTNTGSSLKFTAVRTTRSGLISAGRSSSTRLPTVVLVYLFCVVIPIGFNLGPLYLTTLRLVLILLIVPLFIRLLTGHYGRVYFFDILFALHVFWMGVSLALNSPQQMITQIGSVGAEFLGGYLVGRAYIRDRYAFISLCKALVICVLLLVPFVLFESKTGRPLIVELLGRIPGVNSVEIVTIPGRLGLERVQASFAHPIHFGLFCSVAFSLCFLGLNEVFSKSRRFLTSAIIACSGFLALSSGALLAIALQVALIAWSLVLAQVRFRWWLLVGIFALGYVIIDILSNRTPIQVFMSYATFSAHNAFWRGLIFEWGLKNIFGSPAEGIPAAFTFGIGMKDWVRPWYMHSGSMDNFWLVIAVRYGVPALLILLIGYATVIFRIMCRDFTSDATLTYIRRAWVFTILGLSFTLCTVHVWTNIASFVFFIFGSGVWLITENADATARTSQAGPRRQKERVQGASGPVSQDKELKAPFTRFPPSPTLRQN